VSPPRHKYCTGNVFEQARTSLSHWSARLLGTNVQSRQYR